MALKKVNPPEPSSTPDPKAKPNAVPSQPLSIDPAAFAAIFDNENNEYMEELMPFTSLMLVNNENNKSYHGLIGRIPYTVLAPNTVKKKDSPFFYLFIFVLDGLTSG